MDNIDNHFPEMPMKSIVKEIDTLLKIDEYKQNSIVCSMYLNENFTGFDGHFEGRPVLPAICYFAIIKNAINKILTNKKAMISEIKDAKFFRITEANDLLEVTITGSVAFSSIEVNDEIRVDAVFSRKHEKCAKVKAFLKVY